MKVGRLCFFIRNALFSSLTRLFSLSLHLFCSLQKSFINPNMYNFFTTFSASCLNRTKVFHFKSEVELKMKTHERYGMVVVLRIEHCELESLFVNCIISREKILSYNVVKNVTFQGPYEESNISMMYKSQSTCLILNIMNSS